MGNKILVQINFFGPFLKNEDVSKILAGQTFEEKNNLPDFKRELISSFFDLPAISLSEEMLKSYIEATTEESHMSITPHTKEIYERLLKPLKSAKKNYCLGEYSATIALCGVVGEMLAILLWKMNDVRLKGSAITEDQEKGLFGRTFEKLGQEKRLEILKTFGHTNNEQHQVFKNIKDSRNHYLHLWILDSTNEKSIALETLKKSFILFKEITGIGLADAGSVKVNPLLLKLFKNIPENH
ncbi:MAG: hypothetical protein COU31_04840 [Candidatus Magasanikbacteria bacterium CG10_big_fil_rev_8_21_14_0_10_40_10]|uniref:DUF4145 domain-containing protein n=1 Tax=Candidatus Magasanikbacteria bacterium CG10_big_fil_rev_8_21_14_0_10_40_10 TaxID=1974648 RepID=A0A2M6W2X4_9BACT|nr:MAG: hypothetical protein COU31_04840 [Candidatus Magasanikbacteria bacterium CG10_big_fil_rev_8_21_14_0_10_40_10]